MSLYHYLLDYWQQNYTPTNNRWKEYYRVIANANNILKLIDPSSEDPANLNIVPSPLVSGAMPTCS